MQPPWQKFAKWLAFDTCDDPELEKLVAACQEWANAFKAKEMPRWLTIIGTSGVGKTYCAKRLFRWAANRSWWGDTGYIHRPIYWPDLVHQLRKGEASELREDIKRWPVLLLDDIGSAHESSFSFSELNTNLECREGRWTIITSNLPLDTIAKIDGRIAARFIRGRNIIVGVNTRDYAARGDKRK